MCESWQNCQTFFIWGFEMAVVFVFFRREMQHLQAFEELFALSEVLQNISDNLKVSYVRFLLTNVEATTIIKL